MTGSPETLYKLMLLYLLDRVEHPLTNSQLTRFFLDKEYTTYFTLQRVLNELAESRFVTARHAGRSTYYEISEDGSAALKFFLSDISEAAVRDMDEYLEANKMALKNESLLAADFYANAAGDYTVHCGVRENKTTILAIDMTVPDRDTAEAIAMNWAEKSSEIYTHLMHTLLKE